MKSFHRGFALGQIDHYADLDFTGRDQSNIDSLSGKNSEHFRRDTAMAAHTHADDREFTNTFVGGDLSKTEGGLKRLEDLIGLE